MTLVIGYGNRLRGDDGVGWIAVEQMMARRPDVSIQIVQTLTPELAGDIALAHLVIFVDARTGDHPGRVHVERLEHDADADGSAHGLGPASLVAWTARLFGRRPPAYLVTIEGERFGFGETLSPNVERSIPEAVAAIEWVARRAGATRPAARESSATAAC
ncbi:MAG TPA: hydrogenase maturation protease [Vicinamibacterales bacterium]|nr:hydrogenase maturation protease [Vicinamibacterales bacterium]